MVRKLVIDERVVENEAKVQDFFGDGDGQVKVD